MTGENLVNSQARLDPIYNQVTVTSATRIDVLLDPALSAPETIVEKLRQAGYHAKVATAA